MNQQSVPVVSTIAEMIQPSPPPDDHRHRFGSVFYRETEWDLSYLDSFAFHLDPGLGFGVDVVVLFSCHCFTHDAKSDPRPTHEIPEEEWFFDGRERRVLSLDRYQLSRALLRSMIYTLPKRRVVVANDNQRNFMTYEAQNAEGLMTYYSVFFDVEKDGVRKKRLILRVQSAYMLPGLTERQRKAKKVNLNTLLKAAYEGRKIRP